jgi:hypothetical protein
MVGAMIDWRLRTYTNLTVWASTERIRDMGQSNRHVAAVKTVAGKRISARSGIFSYTGGWRQVLFDSPASAENPFTRLAGEPQLTQEARGGQAR